jgi:hypothetical protein
MKLVSIVVPILLFTTQIIAQTSSLESVSSWYRITGNHQINEQFSLSSGAELWYYEPNSNFHNLMLSAGVKYMPHKQHIFGIAYMHATIDTNFKEEDNPNVTEHRLLEQYTFRHTIGRLKIAHRNRIEHRFFYNERKSTNHRYRYQISGTYPIHKTISIIAAEEVLVGLKGSKLVENRFFAGFGLRISSHYSLKLGYIKNHIKQSSFDRVLLNLNINTGI